MKRNLLLACGFVLLVSFSINPIFAQTPTSPAPPTRAAQAKTPRDPDAPRKPRGPIFRANKEQIAQALGILRARTYYAGADTTKLTPEFRAALKQYQTAEIIKPTGTLNRQTLERMSIALTEKQQAMPIVAMQAPMQPTPADAPMQPTPPKRP